MNQIDLEGRTAKISALTAYLTLVFSVYCLKVSNEKDLFDFLPIILSVFLLILNNSIRFYNPTPARLAALLTLGLIVHLVLKGISEDLLNVVFTIAILLLAMSSLFYFGKLFREKSNRKKLKTN